MAGKALDIKAALWAKAQEGEETAEVFRREARAIYEKDAESAAAFLLDAAFANEHDDASDDSVCRDLALAAEILPHAGWVYETSFRMYLKIGDWNAAIEALRKAYEFAQETDSRMAIALTLGDLYWLANGDAKRALEWVETAHAIDENDVAAIYMALWINAEMGGLEGHAKAEQYAEKLARILGTPDERAILYAFAASIQATMGEYSKAYENFRLAFQSDKQNPYILLRYAVLSEKYAKLPEAAMSYALAAQIFEAPELRAAFFRRAAVINGFIGQHERESYYYAEAYKLSADQSMLALSAADAYILAGNMARAAQFEKTIIDIADDEQTRAAHWLALADLIDATTHDDEQTRAALEAACHSSESLAARKRLAALCEKLADDESAAQSFEHIAHAQSWARPAYAWMQANAHLRAQNFDAAIPLLVEQNSTLGHWRLLFTYESTQNHEANARLLEAWARQTKDPATQSALLGHLVTVLTERMHHADIAARYLPQIPQTAPSRSLAFKRICIFASIGRWDEVVAGLEQIATETTDPEEAQVCALEAAIYTDEALHDVDSAIEKLKQLHKKSPAFVPAIVALHHLALRERRFDQLIESNDYRAQFQLANADRASIATENAWAATQMGDDDRALKWFNIARESAPLAPYPLRMLIRLLKKRKAWRDIAQIVDQCDETTNDEETATWRALRRDIDMYCEPSTKSTNPEQKIAPNPDIYTLCSDYIEAYRRDRSQRTIPDWQAWRQKLRDLPEELLALVDWIEAERLRSESTDKKERHQIALRLKRSLNLPYGHCLRASYLRALREDERDEDDTTSWLETYANTTQDRWIREALLREAALRLMHMGNASDEHIRNILATHAMRDANDKRTLWMLERFSATSDDWQALGFFREKLANIDISARARVQTLKTALAPYIDDDQRSHAVRVAQECIKLDSHAISALMTLANIAEDEDDAYSLACIADRLAQASYDDENRLSYGLWAATLWEKALKKREQATKSLAHILAFQPACQRAIEMIESLLTQQRQFEQLSRIYTQAVAATPVPSLQIEWLRKNAMLRAYEIKDIPGATLALARIIEQAPNDKDALILQADLLADQARWAEAVTTLEQLAKIDLTQEKRREINIRLAQILIHHLEQPDKARVILRRHLASFPHDMAALDLLYDIACAQRQWNDAKTTLEEICQTSDDEPHHATPKDVRRARRAFTHIAREAGWGHDLRTLYEREAIQAAIDDRDDFDALVLEYKNHNEIQRLIDVTKRILGQQGDPERIAQYRGCIAALYVANAQHREALAFLSEIIHEAQNTDWAYLARAQALAQAGQIDSAIGEFRRTLKQNIDLTDAFDPFIDALKQTGDTISLAAVTALRHAHENPHLRTTWERCIHGAPRGFFDFELIPIKRTFADAQRYLRMMTPYAYDLFDDAISAHHLTPVTWAQTRCQALFGQNFDVKQVYAMHGLKGAKCRIKFDQPSTLVVDDSILNESNPIQFDFWAAYAMHQAITGASLLDALDDDTIAALFAALCQAKPESEAAQTIKKRLFKTLPRQSRKLFKDGVPFLMVAWQDFRRAMQTRATCLGAIVCASPACALYEAPTNRAFETFLISENYSRFVKLFWSSQN